MVHAEAAPPFTQGALAMHVQLNQPPPVEWQQQLHNVGLWPHRFELVRDPTAELAGIS